MQASSLDNGLVATSATTQLPSFIPDNPVALTEQDMKEVRGEGWVVVLLAMAAGPIVWDIYFNEGLGSIYVTARTLEGFGFTGMVSMLESYGYNF